MESDGRLGTIAVILGVVASAATAWCVVVGEPARFLGFAAPGAVGVQAAWLGTALAGPVPMVVAFVVAGFAARAGSRLARWVVVALMAGALVGMLGEAITYRVLSPGGFDAVPAAFVVVNLTLPATALVLAAGVVARFSPRGRSGRRAP
jgi:hypothetical protein